MAPKVLNLTTKELSAKTWPDLERLFQKPGIGDAWWCWCTFHHTASFSRDNTPRTRAERAVRNRQEKKELVGRGNSHGILVYADGDPVGWCQYGSREELPRIDSNPSYRGLAPKGDVKRLWRITCFVVDRKHRRQGVASVALKGALEAIRKKGG